MIKPITPAEVNSKIVSDVIISSINELISEKYKKNCYDICLKEISDKINKQSCKSVEENIDTKHILNIFSFIREIYEKNGWRISNLYPRDDDYCFSFDEKDFELSEESFLKRKNARREITNRHFRFFSQWSCYIQGDSHFFIHINEKRLFDKKLVTEYWYCAKCGYIIYIDDYESSIMTIHLDERYVAKKQ